MTLATTGLLSRVRAASRVARKDLGDFVHTRMRPAAVDLSQRQQQALCDLRRDGFAVVEEYWPRSDVLALRDRLEAYLETSVNRDFESGAYMRFQDNAAYDEGVRRIFHVERLIPELAAFRQDTFVLAVAAAYYRMTFYSGVLIYQHNTRSNANTRYYHIDSFAKEAKAFLYLDDVDPGNGPFTYLRGSHRRHITRLRKQIVGNSDSPDTSFSAQDLGAMLKAEEQICGPAGTLILSDVRGLHRGSPQIDRSRSALVNYLHRHGHDLYPAKQSSFQPRRNENSVRRSET